MIECAEGSDRQLISATAAAHHRKQGFINSSFFVAPNCSGVSVAAAYRWLRRIGGCGVSVAAACHMYSQVGAAM